VFQSVLKTALTCCTLIAGVANATAVLPTDFPVSDSTIDFRTNHHDLNEVASFGNNHEIDVTVRAFKDVYDANYGAYYLKNSKVKRMQQYGIGICDNYNNCQEPLHGVDNYGNAKRTEVMSFEFDQKVNFVSITLMPLVDTEFKIKFSTSNAGNESDPGYLPLAGSTLENGQYGLNQLGFTDLQAITVPAGLEYGIITLALQGSGNSLILAPELANIGKFKILALDVAPVPLPGSAWFFLTGLATVFGLQKRRV